MIPMQWAMRRRMMMAAQGGVDVANMLIQGSCTFTDYGVVTMGNGNDYRLLAITQSGNLVLTEPVNIEVCVVGGGANGSDGSIALDVGGGAGGISQRSGVSGNGNDLWNSYSYGNGGANGGNGGAQTFKEKFGVEHAPGGSGGLYGGGNGGNARYGQYNGANATYYGSGAGGGAYYSYNDADIGNGGSGYQGIVYVRIPVNQ